jgi:hypothetical protein
MILMVFAVAGPGARLSVSAPRTDSRALRRYHHVMAQARTALDHLLDARTVLVDEARRLAASLTELDSLITNMGGQDRLDGAEDAPPVSGDPVNPAARTAAAPRATARATSRRPANRRSTTRKALARPAADGAAPKSIRLHVLEMLGAEDRDFGLAEIIDRVHDAGIQAHDDAVRSITIKLMKDGRVERVGRGQYRLARRAGAARPSVDEETDSEPGSEPAATDAPPTDTLD